MAGAGSTSGAPACWLDLASLPYYFQDEGYPHPGLARAFRTAAGRVGPDRRFGARISQVP